MNTTWRYWGWLGLKISLATALAGGVYVLFKDTLFRLAPLNERFDLVQTTFGGLLLGLWILPMVWLALVCLCVYYQRYRCRTCARRLRMPVDQGTYATLLLDHPGIEYVCPYGHGKLLVEVWVSDEPAPKWTKYGDFWQELFRR